MHVSLPMYDLPELIEAHEIFWQRLRQLLLAEGVEGVPGKLDWPTDLDTIWQSRDLLLSQTCGYPFLHQLKGHVQLVGIPTYDAPGCDSYMYSSALIVAADRPYRSLADLRGGVAGFNDHQSQSGYNALRAVVAPLAAGAPYFSKIVETGRHEASIDAVATGKIDIAAIDAVTLALLKRHQPTRTAGIRILAFTEKTAGLPFVTRIDQSAEQVRRMQRALQAVFQLDELQEVREQLLLAGCMFPPADVYQALLTQEQTARAAGYPDLR